VNSVDDKLSEIKNHWNDWASEYGDDLRATTKSSNIKNLEIKVLIETITRFMGENKDILEIGCGNGYNAISIANELHHHVDGFDFIPEMIESAQSNKEKLDVINQARLNFFVDDVLDIKTDKKYDLIYSCRCLINLPTAELQNKAISEVVSMIKPGGYFLMLENFIDNHESQNKLRELVGLDKRKPAEFNNFFSSDALYGYIAEIDCEVLDVIDFASLHDVMQYVIVPLLNNGSVDYNHDVINSVTKLLMGVDISTGSSFGSFGQNKLIVVRKK
jgi:SAM-dependent methyltransferase